MRTFVLVALVACMAVIFAEISQANAQRGGGNRRCRQKPELKAADDVTCDPKSRRPSLRLLLRQCKRTCRSCYEPSELTRGLGCLVDRKCVCLAKGDEDGDDSTTTENPEEPSTDQPDPSSTTDGGEETTVPTEETTTPVEETTLPEGGEETSTAA